VLAGAGFGNKAGFAHALGEKGLTKHVVDFVGTGVIEVFALEQHAHTELCRKTVTFSDRRRTAGIIGKQTVEFVAE
jgi:hypothetical protein